jgi:hypothetical protein
MADVKGAAKGAWNFGKDAAKEGLKRRVARRFEGGGSSGEVFQSVQRNSGHPSSSHTGLIVFIIVATLLVWGATTDTFAQCVDSGACGRFVEPLEKPLEGLKGFFKFSAARLDETRKIISGERFVDWDGTTTENIRSGVWFSGGRQHGITLGEINEQVLPVFGGEFGATIDVVVGKFDQDLKNVDVEVFCSLTDSRSDGEVSGIIRPLGIVREKIFDNGIRGGFLNFPNPDPDNKQSYEDVIDCVFKEEDRRILQPIIEPKRTYFSGDILFNMSYSLEPSVSLLVYAIPDINLYNQYISKPEEAFKDLGNGIYNGEVPGGVVKSSMQYVTDVEAVMSFVPQPLAVGESSVFGVKINNINSENEVEFESFKFTLPEGMRITTSSNILDEGKTDCQHFVRDGSGYKLAVSQDEINNQLNRGGKSTRLYICNVAVDDSINDGSEIRKLGEVDGVLSYTVKVSDKVRISN